MFVIVVIIDFEMEEIIIVVNIDMDGKFEL